MKAISLCSVEACGKAPKMGRRICSMHAERIRRHGSTDDRQRGPSPRSPYERVMEKVTVDQETGCWIYHGSRQEHGHGLVRVGSRTDGSSRLVKAHRVTYEHHHGPVADGVAFDHVECQNPPCVNPDHVDPCGQTENCRREADRRTHCHKGHPWVPENIKVFRDGRRTCRTCFRAMLRRNRGWKS